MFTFKPVFNWVLKYCKNYQHIKSLYTMECESLKDFRMGYENLNGDLDEL